MQAQIREGYKMYVKTRTPSSTVLYVCYLVKTSQTLNSSSDYQTDWNY